MNWCWKCVECKLHACVHSWLFCRGVAWADATTPLLTHSTKQLSKDGCYQDHRQEW